MLKTLALLVKLVRLPQAIKNVFIFMPVFFAGLMLDMHLLYVTFLGFLAFTCVTSAVYIFNDLLDVKEDRQHPVKQYRPLASAAISTQLAVLIMSVLVLVGIGFMFSISPQALLIVMFYVLMNIAYTLVLKKIAIIDVCVIAIGFVLRLFIGSVITQVPLSMWIVLMTFFLALFIALAKRRDDVLIFEQTGKHMRAVIKGYNLKFLDASLLILAAVTIVAYLLYTVSTEITQRLDSDYVYISTLFVMLGLLRYLQIIFVENNSGSPVQLLFTDVFLQLVIVTWLAFFMWILY